jgi:hypothetical protein
MDAMPRGSQHVRALPCALASTLCLSTALALPGFAGAAEGGPAPNIPVPASASTPAGSSAAATIVTATTPAAGGAAAAVTTVVVPAPAATTHASTPGAVPTRTTGAAPATAGSHPAARSSTSNAAVVIAALAAVLALGCIAWALGRSRAFEPRWALSLRHAMAEAGYRTSATWAELTDWFRLGH